MEHGTNLFQIQKLLGLVESTLKRSSELVTGESMGFISQVQTTHAVLRRRIGIEISILLTDNKEYNIKII